MDHRAVKLTPEEVEGSIEELEAFSKSQGWSVRYSEAKIEDGCEGTVITLYKRRKREIQYYMLLHELGHLWMQRCDLTYHLRYPDAAVRKRYATVTYKIERVLEEIEAWETGKKLAFSLGLRLDQKKFEKLRAECLTTYMSWAAKPRPSRNQTKKD